MGDDSKVVFAVIRFNSRTYAAGGVMAIVKGRVQAEATKAELELGQSAADRQEGWRYFLEKTDLKPGMNPQDATHARDSRQDIRESEGPE